MWREATFFSVVIIFHRYYNKSMKTEDVYMHYEEMRCEFFNEHYRKGVTGIILTAIILSLLFVVQKITLPYEEETAAIHFTSAIQSNRLDAGFVVPENVYDENLKEESVFVIPTVLKDEIRNITSGRTKANFPELRAEVEIDTAVLDAEPETEIETVIDYPGGKESGLLETAPLFIVDGNLRMDYCVGSEPDLKHLSIKLGDEAVPLDACTVEGLDTSVPGEKILTIIYGENRFELPYGVVEYRVIFDGNGGSTEVFSSDLYNYRLRESDLVVPVYEGKVFTGWYLDPEASIPFEKAEQGQTELRLYAGWKEVVSSVYDESGYLVSGRELVVEDGLLYLPSDPECVGIRSEALASFGGEVTDVYIPANICYIEPGSFDTLTGLFYIEVDANNPYYCSIEGVLYTKDATSVVAYPKGRVW